VLGGKAVSVDIFDKPETLAKLWGRFVDGIVFDALEDPDTRRRAAGNDFSVKLYNLKGMTWRKTEATGLGETYRAQDGGIFAAVLVMDERPVHLGMSMQST